MRCSHNTNTTTWLDPRVQRPKKASSAPSTHLLRQLEQTLRRQEEERHLAEMKRHMRDDSGYMSRTHSDDEFANLV